MSRIGKRVLTAALVAAITMTPVTRAFATDAAEVSDDTDEVEITSNDKPYLALGENLTEEQKRTVLGLMGIDEAGLADFNVQYVTNEEEHSYLGDYISSDKIGTKALSTIVIVEGEKGAGLNISTYNISYCTVGMYKNALVTAGVEDADIIVAGPFSISGTAALVGIIKAYEEMTGEAMPQENVDTALNEIVVTGSIEAGDADAETVEGFIAFVKKEIAERGDVSKEEIKEIIEDAQDQFEISLNENEVQKVTELMEKINELDLDPDKLKEQAQAIYDKIAEFDSDGTIRGWFAKIIEAIKDFFSSLF